MVEIPFTTMGGAARDFPSTQWTWIREARDRTSPAFRQALNGLCLVYWKPIYAFIRAVRSPGNEEAKDLTQRFFLELIEGTLLSRFSPDRGSFRAYLKGAARRFLLECHREGAALKRGGGEVVLQLGDQEVGILERLLQTSTLPPEELFEREWAKAVFEFALQDLRRDLTECGKEIPLRVFERYYLPSSKEERPSHALLAQEFGLSEIDVNHYVEAGRQALRERVVARVREYVGEESEVAEEVARLFAK